MRNSYVTRKQISALRGAIERFLVRRKNRVRAICACLSAFAFLGAGGAAASEATPTVAVRSHPQYGEVLVGPDGMTLYTFERDEAGVGSCVRGCARNWPPLVVEGGVLAADPLSAELATIERSEPERRRQVTYRGRPLYYWSRDEAPGDVKGHGIGDAWFVATP